MSRILSLSVLLPILLWGAGVHAADQETQDKHFEEKIETLKKPMFTPFVELYVLEEMKKLRIDLADQKHELMQQVLDREHKAVDRAVAYATDTITYFFYLIAGATSILLLVGWNSLREIRERMHSLADEEVSKLVDEYEKRLQNIEQQLSQKTRHIQENKEEIELTQDIQSLWLRAGQETNPATKIEIYDEILKLKPDDCEALTYKADAVLELDEPQWASNLCHQALAIDPSNCHAFFQLGCAYTTLHLFEDAVHYLSKALEHKESYRDSIRQDKALIPLHDYAPYQALISGFDDAPAATES
ncbi:MAG: hypothetical protein C9356_14160 [Oleiphilus sp.]|nr:MAG: hypothetical protein C9356_14160 [Oleiphilus sp.]